MLLLGDVSAVTGGEVEWAGVMTEGGGVATVDTTVLTGGGWVVCPE